MIQLSTAPPLTIRHLWQEDNITLIIKYVSVMFITHSNIHNITQNILNHSIDNIAGIIGHFLKSHPIIP